MAFVSVLGVMSETLCYPDELLDYLWESSYYPKVPDWGGVWKFLKDQGVVFHRYLAVKDLLGWYLKIETLGPTGFETTDIQDGPWMTKEDALDSVNDDTKFKIYGYIE